MGMWAQICAIFEHKGPSDSLLQPASNREVLAALLATLRDSHWCAAVGCQPEPGLMVPISIATALRDRTVTAQVTGEGPIRPQPRCYVTCWNSCAQDGKIKSQ